MSGGGKARRGAKRAAMPVLPGIIDVDLHGMTRIQAELALDSALRRAPQSTYRLRVIHGYTRGTELRDMVRTRGAKNPRVVRVEFGLNLGQTELVLREF